MATSYSKFVLIHFFGHSAICVSGHFVAFFLIEWHCVLIQLIVGFRHELVLVAAQVNFIHFNGILTLCGQPFVEGSASTW